MEVLSCGLHGFAEAIGIDVDEVRVYWKLNFAAEHSRQAAYRVVISTKPNISFDSGNDNDGVCFDSGRHESSAQRDIRCTPQGFMSTTLYYWIVRVWDQNGNEATSRINEFYTSYPRSSRLLPPYSMNQTYV